MANIESKILSMIVVLILILIIVAISVTIYIIPLIVAIKKKHPYKVPIILINIFLGWSFLGWVGALIWACILPEQNNTNNQYNNKYEDLAKLQKLKEDGAITEIEFEIEKQKILK